MTTAQNLNYPNYLDEILLMLRPGIVIVDMQEHYLKHIKPEQVKRLVENQSRVLKLAAQNNLDVAVLEGVDHPATIEPLQRLISQIEGAYYYAKPGMDGFENPRFEKRVKSWDKRNLFFMGVYASWCLSVTAYGGTELGYIPITSECVIGDINRNNIRSARSWFRENGLYLR